MPEPHEIDAAAKAICLVQFGSEIDHGDARCCQVGGVDGCCMAALLPAAEAALVAAEQVRNAPVLVADAEQQDAHGRD